MTTIDWTITDQYRTCASDPSPILWQDLQLTKKKVFWAPPKYYRTFTLINIVHRVSIQEGNLFFRKVGPLSQEEVTTLFQIINQKLVSTDAPVAAGEDAQEDLKDGPQKKKPVRGLGAICLRSGP